MNDTPKIPKELDAIVDKVLAYKPKPKSEAAKKRKKRSAKALRVKSSTKTPSSATKNNQEI